MLSVLQGTGRSFQIIQVSSVFAVLDKAPRRTLALVCVVSVAMLAFGLYLQHSEGLNPCPMCIVQRYALIFVAITAGLTAASGKKLYKYLAHC